MSCLSSRSRIAPPSVTTGHDAKTITAQRRPPQASATDRNHARFDAIALVGPPGAGNDPAPQGSRAASERGTKILGTRIADSTRGMEQAPSAEPAPLQRRRPSSHQAQRRKPEKPSEIR
jgi:hypothetical protein